MDQQSVNKLFGSLSKEQQMQVQQILADKSRTEQILKTPQAQELLKKLTGGKKNG